MPNPFHLLPLSLAFLPLKLKLKCQSQIRIRILHIHIQEQCQPLITNIRRPPANRYSSRPTSNRHPQNHQSHSHHIIIETTPPPSFLYRPIYPVRPRQKSPIRILEDRRHRHRPPRPCSRRPPLIPPSPRRPLSRHCPLHQDLTLGLRSPKDRRPREVVMVLKRRLVLRPR